MSPHYRYFALTTLLVTCMLAVSCAAPPEGLPSGEPSPADSTPQWSGAESLQLSSFTDPINEVAVSVRLARAADGSFLLSATFTPPEGYHLYSKDIPPAGVRGQGRPTRLDLPAGAKMQAAGTLTESVGANVPGYVPDGAPIYPPGPVTLTLPVSLPEQAGWLEDQISLTYMACTEYRCTAPTVGKLVQVNIPGAEAITK
jgi:hypothetical protein